MVLKKFFQLSKLFKSQGFRLWLVGGSSRDYLMGLPLKDFDLTTDALPSEMKTLIPEANFRFAHYGTVQFEIEDQRYDITTLRQESVYRDKRHPQSITFVKEPKLDYFRRDLTINAIYLDSDLTILDFASGQEDIENKVLRMIGDPYLRLQEDPLRILRIIRFQHRFGFHQEPMLARALTQSLPLLEYLNPQKVSLEIQKMLIDRPHEAKLLLASYGIKSE